MLRYLTAFTSVLFTAMVFGQSISSVAPNSGERGTFQLPVVISGSNTNFSNATSTLVRFSQGTSTLMELEVTNINSVSPTSVSCDIQIPYSAALGNYTVSVFDQNVGGMLDLPAGFTVLPNSQTVTLVGTTPQNAAINQTLPITISVDNAHFSQATNTSFFLMQQGTNTMLFPVPGTVFTLNNSHLKAQFDFTGYAIGTTFDAYCSNSFDGYFYDDSAVVLTSPTSISGNLNYAGNYDGIVELYQENTNVSPYTYSLVSSSPVLSNVYSFSNIAQANYYVRSVPIGVTNVVATYYPSDVSWTTATQISTISTPAITGALITPVSSLWLSGGGTVNGSIGYGPSGFTKSSGLDVVFAEGIEVFLMDTDNSSYAQTTTNANGAYSFAGVEIGNYKIVIDLPGYAQISSYNFGVTSHTAELTDLDFLIDNGEIFVSGFMGLETQKLANLVVYPNPTTGEIHIQLPANSTQSKVMIYNHMGQKVLEQNISLNASPIFTTDLSEFGDGVYTIQVQSDKGVAETRLIKTE
ncbi:MAG: T9SS type A sorting domain-containing protein [Crocinitomicaceae bacterium]